MGDIEEPDILVQRLHQIAVRHGLNVKDMAEKCGVPKSSLEGYMRLKGAKRPGIDALIMISKGFDVSIDWLVGRTDGELLGEDERKAIALGVHTLLCSVLLNLEELQLQNGDAPILRDGKVGYREIEEYAQRMLLNYVYAENLFPPERFDTFRIINQILENTDDIPNHLVD